MKNAMSLVKDFLRGLDKVLVLLCLGCTAISLLCLFSMFETGFISRARPIVVQFGASMLGLVCALVISQIDYKVLANLWKIYVPITVILVALTYVIGEGGLEGSDDVAWLDIGITKFQPSELLKLAFIFTFALHLMKRKEHINELKPLLLLCLHGAIPVFMIVLQGDLGTAIIFFAIFLFMIIAAGLSARWTLAGVVAVVAVAPFVWMKLPDYLQLRFKVAWRPEEHLDTLGVQQYRGRIAVGSGGLWGKGLLSDDIYYVPVAESDFILSYIGQILGFVGIVITLLLITALCVKILMIAKMSKDYLGNYICIGVFAMFLVQTIINVGMVFCVSPVVGVTLPFISSGGTSAAALYLAIGMVLSVYRQNKREMMFD